VARSLKKGFFLDDHLEEKVRKAQQGGEPGAGGPGAGEPGKKEDVVDAEFTEVNDDKKKSA